MPLTTDSSWVQVHPSVNPQMRLFCLPHAGGGGTSFRAWKTQLPEAIEICPILLPGREIRISEPLFTSIDLLVDAMTASLQRSLEIPYAIFGHSMGALLAFEWVRRIQRQRLPMPAWLFLSGRRAPDLKEDFAPLHSLPDNEFIQELIHRYNGFPPEIVENSELLELFLPILRADVSVVESYRFLEMKPLDCRLTVFAGRQDASVTWAQLIAWKRHTSHNFSLQIFPGGHFYPHGPMLNTIASTLAQFHT